MPRTSAFILVAALSIPRGVSAQDTQALDGCATLHGTRVALDTLALEIRTDSACAPLIIELVSPSLVPLPRLRAGESGDWVEIGLRVVNRSAETLRAPLYLYADDDLRGTVGGRAIVSWRMRAFVILHTTYEDLWSPARGDLPPPTGGNRNSQRLHIVAGATAPGYASSVTAFRLNVAADAETFDLSLVVRARRVGSVPPPPPQAPAAPPARMPAESIPALSFDIGRAPPADSGQAPQDPAIRRFVSSLRLPSVHAVRDLLFLRKQGLLFFSVIYGEPMEVYGWVVGVRRGNRIGLLLRPSEHPWQVTDTTRVFPRFTLRRGDMTLADAEVLDTLEASPSGLVDRVLPVLVDDPLVPSAVLRRCVRRIYANAGACLGPDVAGAATRIEDIGTLTQLALLSGKWSGEGETIIPAREGLRQLAPLVLRQRHPPRPTLVALASTVASSRSDTLLAQLAAHPAVREDPGLLALIADDHPTVVHALVDLLPDGPGVRAAIASLFDPRRWLVQREAIVALLNDLELGRNPAILASIANAPPTAFPAASAEASGRIPELAARRGAYLVEPPAVP